MTPEEQFMKIENALQHAAEIQAEHAESIVRLESAIRDLISVSRTLGDSQQGLADLHKDLAEAQRLHVQQTAELDKKLSDRFEQADEQRKRDREEFSANFNALLQGQFETEQKLQRWMDRQGPSQPAS
jgi:hypothetical protein